MHPPSTTTQKRITCRKKTLYIYVGSFKLWNCCGILQLKKTLIPKTLELIHEQNASGCCCTVLLNGRGKKKNHQNLGLQVLPGEENGQSCSDNGDGNSSSDQVVSAFCRHISESTHNSSRSPHPSHLLLHYHPQALSLYWSTCCCCCCCPLSKLMMVRRRTLGHHQWGHMHHCHYRHHNNSIQTKENKNKISLLQQQQQQWQNLSATKAQRWKLWVLEQTAKLLVVQNKNKNLHQRSLIFFTTCVINLQTKQERQRVEEQLPKFSPTFVFYDLCG